MGAKTKHRIHLHFICLYMCAITLLHACSVMSGLRVSDLQRISVLGFQGSTRNLDVKETFVFLDFSWLQLAGLSCPASDIPPQDRARREDRCPEHCWEDGHSAVGRE